MLRKLCLGTLKLLAGVAVATAAVELLFAFKGIQQVEAPENRIRPA